MKIDHIGYLSNDINASIAAFTMLGYEQATEVIRDDVVAENGAVRNVDLCFLENNGTRIELVSPIGETSDVYSTLKRQGEGPYHICYAVEDLEQSIDELKKGMWMVLKKPTPAIAFRNARVAFLFKKGIGLIELVETNAEGENQ